MTSGVPTSVPRHVASHRRGRWLRRPIGRPAALRVDDWRVRTKLIAVLAVPMLGFVAVAGIQANAGIDAASDLSDFSRQVALGRQITVLVDVLQRERDHTAGLMSATERPGEPRPVASTLNADWAAVDAAVGGFRRAAQPVLGTVTAYAGIGRHLDELVPLRQGVLGGWLRQGAVFDAYSKMISDLIGLLPAPTMATGDSLARAVRVVRDVAQIKEFTAQLRGRLYAVCAAGSFGPGDAATLADTRAQRRAVIDQLRADATATQVDRYDTAAGGSAARSANRLEQNASTGNQTGPRVSLDAQQWWQASSQALDAVRAAEISLLDDAVDLAGSATAANWRTTAAALAIVVLVLLIAVLTALLVSRSMVDPLRRMRDHALDVAQRSLPDLIERMRRSPRGEASTAALAAEVEPVEIRSRDEIGEVADAFTAVHRAAVRLAGEQAATRRNLDASLINLARRSQILVERQLQALDALEAGETDPETLAQLFTVDHLATRMRRNDENLLVLAGADTSRRRNAPLPLAAIVLAATAEVEHYPRVRSTIDDDVYLVGHATGDVIHLLAELLENATLFSPPHTDVTVRGVARAPGGAELVIRDEGIGMTPAGIVETNQQLATPASPDAASSERMGLVVVAHLAAKHRIEVELRAAAPGTAVHVRLPAGLISDPPDQFDEATPAPWLATGRPPAPTGPVLAIEAAPAPLDVIEPDEVLAAPAQAQQAPAPAPVSPPRGSAWWSRDTGGGATANTNGGTNGGATSTNGGGTRDTGGGAVAGRTSSAGLPLRVPQAQRPGADTPLPTASGTGPAEPDPDEVGAMLTSLIRGLRRADDDVSEEDAPLDPTDTTEIPGIDRQGAPR